jgi:hypothetical protein
MNKVSSVKAMIDGMLDYDQVSVRPVQLSNERATKLRRCRTDWSIQFSIRQHRIATTSLFVGNLAIAVNKESKWAEN